MRRTSLTLSFAEIISLYTNTLSAEAQEKVDIIRDISRLMKVYGQQEPMPVYIFDLLYDMDIEKLRSTFTNYADTMERGVPRCRV